MLDGEGPDRERPTENRLSEELPGECEAGV